MDYGYTPSSSDSTPPGDRRVYVRRGATFRLTYRPALSTLIYRAVSAITNSAPVEITTVAAHGLPDGWPVRVTGARGMTEINDACGDWLPARVTGADTLEINAINATQYGVYVAGSATLQYNEPMALAGASARMQVRSPTTHALLFDATASMAVDDVAKTVSLLLPASETEGFAWPVGLADVELELADGTVYALDRMQIVTQDERTRL